MTSQKSESRSSRKTNFWISIFIFGLCILIFDFSPPAQAMARRPSLPAREVTEAKPAPLTLQECFALALKRSETVLIQKEDIKEAEAQFFKAASEALGDADFVMTYSKQKELPAGEGGVSGSFTDPDRRERKFVVKQPLFRGFRALGALVGAGSLKKQQKEEWIRAQQLLFLDVAGAFYGLLREKKKSSNHRRNLPSLPRPNPGVGRSGENRPLARQRTRQREIPDERNRGRTRPHPCGPRDDTRPSGIFDRN